MKKQIQILRELQERILIREGGLAGLADAEGVGRNLAEIAHLTKMLEPKVAATYEWLLKKNRIVIAAMSDGACTGCGMRVPTALQQTVKLGKVMCVCPNCGRILYLLSKNQFQRQASRLPRRLQSQYPYHQRTSPDQFRRFQSSSRRLHAYHQLSIFLQ